MEPTLKYSVWIESGSDHGKKPPDHCVGKFDNMDAAIAKAKEWKDDTGWSWAYIRVDFVK